MDILTKHLHTLAGRDTSEIDGGDMTVEEKRNSMLPHHPPDVIKTKIAKHTAITCLKLDPCTPRPTLTSEMTLTSNV
jgi:hypothetical protein